MKSKISALMDGELAQHEAGGALEALRVEGEARDGWRRYHLIGDLMRDTHAAFGRVCRPRGATGSRRSPRCSRLRAGESRRRGCRSGRFPRRRAWRRSRWWAGSRSVPADDAAGRRRARRRSLAAQEAPQVAPPAAANDYLLAHQGYSPRNSLQGVAPYVRTVSGDMRGPGR